MKNFLVTLSGARPEILDRCPTERLKFQSLGWAILITSGMAVISMWFALYSAMGINPIVALLAALVWGLIIMGIDRWLVTSMPLGGARRWTIALPRLLLALLLGTLISTPLVLRIFQSEINAQITVIKQQRASAFIVEQQHSQVGQQVIYWRNDVTNLQKVIDSGGAVTLNPSTDPQIKSLTKQHAAAVTLDQKYYQQWQCQLYGGKGCTLRGNGVLAQASERSYKQEAAQVAALNHDIQLRLKQLTNTDARSKHLRLQQATAAQIGAQQQLAFAVARQDELRQSFDSQNVSTNGLLIRLQALTQLSGSSFTLNAARLLLFLLFLVIECLPVSVKLLQQPGNYEKILRAASERELVDATRAYRTRPRVATAHGPDVDLGATRDAGLHDIWQPTKELFDPPTSEMPEPMPDEPDASEEHIQLVDDALRKLDDNRVTVDADGGGGIELRYNDDYN